MRIQVFCDVTLCCQLCSSRKLEGSSTLLTYCFIHSIQVHVAIAQRIQNMSKIHIIHTKGIIYTVRENEKQSKSSSTLNFKGEAGNLVLKSFLHFIVTGLAQ